MITFTRKELIHETCHIIRLTISMVNDPEYKHVDYNAAKNMLFDITLTLAGMNIISFSKSRLLENIAYRMLDEECKPKEE